MMKKNNDKDPGTGRDNTFVREAGELAKIIVDTVREPLMILDGDLRVISANKSFYGTFGVKPGETEKKLIYELGDRQWDIPELRRLLEKIIPGHTSFNDFKVEHDFPDIGRRTMVLNARRIPRPPEKPKIILLAIEDITEREHLKNILEASEERYRRAFETSPDGMLLINKDTGQILNSNTAAWELFGYSHESLLEKKIWEIGITEDKTAFGRAALLLEEKGFINYIDTFIRTSEGREISADIYMVDRAKVIQCNIRDITARKREEEEMIRKMHYLEIFHRAAVDRELKMKALEKRIAELESELKARGS